MNFINWALNVKPKLNISKLGGEGLRICALLTCTISSSHIQLEARVTNTAKHPKYVFALSINAQVSEHVTFVNVCNTITPWDH